MSLARTLLLRASRSPWLAEQFRTRAFARRAVRKFMPGESLGEALDAAAALAKDNLGTVLTQLGEQVQNAAEATAVRDHYLQVFDQVRQRSLPAHVSVKLTHLGLDVSREACSRHMLDLAAKARADRTFLWIDMEEARYVDATLDIYRRVRADGPGIGVCLQAYLRRTPQDLTALLPIGPAVRLVKGAYRESPEIALQRKDEIDAQYATLASQLLDATAGGRATVVFGTHDLDLVERIGKDAVSRNAATRYEVHMLYGIRTEDQRALARRGVKLRVLISYGSHWFAWYMRRLAERPANIWFVVRSAF
ncbi:MAG TPA: proline dehydrogenase family protein [Gemmatimonadales bacterium]|nr:proline dehydrogenase family protein [Gemmatimonadales bacterium]